MSYGYGAYKKTAVSTASKEQILLMLYQAAIKNCKKAIEAIEAKQIAQKGEYIGKLQDLSSLYDYMLFASTQANIKIEAEPLQGCLSVLNTLYEGWSEAIKSLKITAAPTSEETKK